MANTKYRVASKHSVEQLLLTYSRALSQSKYFHLNDNQVEVIAAKVDACWMVCQVPKGQFRAQLIKWYEMPNREQALNIGHRSAIYRLALIETLESFITVISSSSVSVENRP